jgi:2-isopropylmalate synthase
MSPEDIGLTASRFVLGKHSGRHAFRKRVSDLGYDLPDQELQRAYERFIELADKKKEVSDLDIEALVRGELTAVEDLYTLEYLHVCSGMAAIPTATVRIVKEGSVVEEAACGDGPVDAAYRAIDRIIQLDSDAHLEEYSLRAVTGGKDALGEVSVRVTAGGKTYTGRGVSTDVIEASVRAYLNAMNKAGSDLRRAAICNNDQAAQ